MLPYPMTDRHKEMFDTTELMKLVYYLKGAGANYVIKHRDVGTDYEWHQVVVDPDSIGRWDVIYSVNSYGWESGLLELMANIESGMITPREFEEDGVVGYLSADDVIQRYENKEEDYKAVWTQLKSK